jgi:hypothetical protein
MFEGQKKKNLDITEHSLKLLNFLIPALLTLAVVEGYDHYRLEKEGPLLFSVVPPLATMTAFISIKKMLLNNNEQLAQYSLVLMVIFGMIGLTEDTNTTLPERVDSDPKVRYQINQMLNIESSRT